MHSDLNITPAAPVALLSAKQLAALNPGIRHTVQTLRSWGFETCDSGDGVTHEFECDLDVPYVHILCPPALLASETDRLVNLLRGAGINFEDGPDPQDDPVGAALHPNVEACYLPLYGADSGYIHLFNVILPDNIPNP